ncbi:MAG: OB-fold nucleic acid binding domain-containing protein [Nanoarchaeota archaeon]
MQIKNLQPRQGKVELTATVAEKGEPRTVNSANFSGTVANAKLQDETGTIKISLWNDQIAQVNVGDTIKITNGYVSEYQGEMQLSTGKFGKLEVVTKGSDGPSASAAPDNPAAKSAPAKKEQVYDEFAEDDGADDVSEEFVE